MAPALIGTERAPGAVCGSCGRRFPALAPADRCSICGGRELAPAELAEEGIVLAWTRVHRSRPTSLFAAPYEVVHVREATAEGDAAASFNCPLLGDGEQPALGSRVALRVGRWKLDDGDRFTGLVACRR